MSARDCVKQTATFNGTAFALDAGAAASGFLTFGAGYQVPSTGVAPGTIYWRDVAVRVEVTSGTNAGKWAVYTADLKRDAAGVLTLTPLETITRSDQAANALVPALTLATGDTATLAVVPTGYVALDVRRRLALTQVADGADESSVFSAKIGLLRRSSLALLVCGEQANAAGESAVCIGDGGGELSVSAFGKASYVLGRSGVVPSDYAGVLAGYGGFVNSPYEVCIGAMNNIYGHRGGTTPVNPYLAKISGARMAFTTDATPTTMLTYDPMTAGDASTDTPSIANNIYCDAGLTRFKARLTAINAATNDMAAWDLDWTVKTLMDYSATSLFGALSKTVFHADAGAAAWDVDVTVESVNNTCSIVVTGEAATELVWMLEYASLNATVYL